MAYPTLSDITRAREHDQAAHAFSKYLFAHGRAAVEGLPVRALVESTPGLERFRTKAGVPGGTVDNLAPLVGDGAGRAFLALVARRTVLGQLSGTLAAPPHMFVPSPTTLPTPYWIVEGAPIPLSQLTFNDPLTSISKYAVLLVFSQEVFRLADDRALGLVERAAMRALRHAEDSLLLSDDAAIPNGAPAGLLNGLTPAGAGSPSTLHDDLLALWTSVSDGEPDRPHYVVSARGAEWLAGLNQDGSPLFPNIGPTGGTIHTVPTVISKAAGNKLVLIDAANLVVTDEGLEVKQSEQAAIEMLDNPTNNSATPTGTNVVSMFQANATALRLIRWLHWTLATDDAVGYLELPIDNSPN